MDTPFIFAPTQFVKRTNLFVLNPACLAAFRSGIVNHVPIIAIDYIATGGLHLETIARRPRGAAVLAGVYRQKTSDSIALFACAPLTACRFISPYDQAAYAQAVNLKVDILALIDKATARRTRW